MRSSIERRSSENTKNALRELRCRPEGRNNVGGMRFALSYPNPTLTYLFARRDIVIPLPVGLCLCFWLSLLSYSPSPEHCVRGCSIMGEVFASLGRWDQTEISVVVLCNVRPRYYISLLAHPFAPSHHLSSPSTRSIATSPVHGSSITLSAIAASSHISQQY